jgi:hypothetical protein
MQARRTIHVADRSTGFMGLQFTDILRIPL